MSFPKWKYHKTEAPKLIHSEAEEMALGSSWKESPADFEVEAMTNIEAQAAVESGAVEIHAKAEATEPKRRGRHRKA